MSRNRTILALLLAALLLALGASFCLGASSVTLPALLRALITGERESVAARVFCTSGCPGRWRRCWPAAR